MSAIGLLIIFLPSQLVKTVNNTAGNQAIRSITSLTATHEPTMSSTKKYRSLSTYYTVNIPVRWFVEQKEERETSSFYIRISKNTGGVWGPALTIDFPDPNHTNLSDIEPSNVFGKNANTSIIHTAINTHPAVIIKTIHAQILLKALGGDWCPECRQKDIYMETPSKKLLFIRETSFLHIFGER